ncbi:hypothetical protein PUMCH_000309 [Australozyma saopauloensis]|uniref:Ribosome assembly protein 3 n=1 Tax=Australozyma saopauloensis TaxID=291208 RepID=A0AAX4H448_9ASCO|nr:hypothetical protein PUMCH_000309 [[Candida] saopauloensis]
MRCASRNLNREVSHYDFIMAPDSVLQKQSKSRRRKKRRTQDSSSESSSDSSDHSENEQESVKDSVSEQEAPAQEKSKIDIIDIEMDSENESGELSSLGALPEATLKKMASVKFTSTENQNIEEAKSSVRRDRKELDAAFLGQMAGTFASELDELRQKPDFTDKSIVILAKTLQSGSNMFDEDTLEALLKE